MILKQSQCLMEVDCDKETFLTSETSEWSKRFDLDAKRPRSRS